MVAGRSIARGELVEESPVVVMEPEQHHHVESSPVDGLLFAFGPKGTHRALALGLGTLFRFGSEANLRSTAHWKARCLRFFARRAIAAGEMLSLAS